MSLTYFDQSQGETLQTDIISFLKNNNFARRSDLLNVIKFFIQFFVVNMTAGNEINARRLLESHNFQIRRQDAIQIAFYAGAALIMLLFGLLFSVVPTYDTLVND